MIKALIIEDQPNISDHLTTLIRRNFADIELLGICDTVAGSLKAINEGNPDLVFMDVELNPPETGFDILKKLSSIKFKIIFTTAYNQYALQAIKFSALDYLLKPVDEEELRAAVIKFTSNRSTLSDAQHSSILNYEPGNQNCKIGLPGLDGILFVRVQDILYCEGESAQAYVHLHGGKKHLITRTLRECEEILEPFEFCRIHKSYLVNLRCLEKYHKGDGGSVSLEGGKHLDVSKTYKDEMLSRLKRL